MLAFWNNERHTAKTIKIHDINLGLNSKKKKYYDCNMEICVRDCTHRQPVDPHVLNFNNISYFDSISYKEYFSNWILDLQDYNYV